MTTFYVLVAPGPVVVLANRSRPMIGFPIGYSLYEVQAADKTEAREKARQLYRNDHK